MPEDNLVKILFRFYSDMLEEETTETLYAEVVDEQNGYYKLDDIPFYAPKIASGDVVWAEFDEAEGALTYRKTIRYSGNSTIHVYIIDDGYDINGISKIFDDMGCESRNLTDKYFSIDVPAELDYIPVKRNLDELEKEGVLDYAESWLSGKHQYKDISFGF